MTRQSILSLVSGYPIFNCCDAQNLNKYLTDDTLMISDFQSGEVIFSPIESKKSIGVILSGTAVATPTSASDNALLKILTTNDIFGIATLYAENDAFPSIITAKSSCSVLFIDGIAFKQSAERKVAQIAVRTSDRIAVKCADELFVIRCLFCCRRKGNNSVCDCF